VSQVDLAKKLARYVYDGVDIQTVMTLKNQGYTLEQIVSFLEHREVSKN
jgi:hypothetical protein